MSVSRLLMLLLLMQCPLRALEWPQSLGESPRAWLRLAAADSLAASIGAQGEASGLPADLVEGWFARWAYGTTSLSGIDLHRSARLFWRRTGAVLAVIPLADRQRFIDDFSGLPLSGIDLVRTGERDGTIIYAWNGPTAIHEYRLLIRDGTAYLGPDVAACLALAAHDWPHLRGDEAPLYYQALDPRLDPGLVTAALPDTAPAGLRALLQATAAGLAEALAGGFSSLICEVRAETGGRWHLHAELAARAGSPVALWLSRQEDRSSRLLPALPHDEALLSWYGAIDWGGQLAGSRTVQEAAAASLPPELLPVGWREAVRLLLSQWDQRGAFAGVLIQEAERLRAISASRHPQPAAWRVAWRNLVELYDGPLAGRGWQLADDADGAAVGDLRLYWTTIARQQELRWCTALGMDEQILVAASGAAEPTNLIPLVVPVLKRLRQTGPPVGEAALLAVRCDAAAWMRRWARLAGVAHAQARHALAVPVELLVTTDQQGRIHIDLPIDPEALADAHQSAGLRLEHWRALLP